MSVKYYVLCGFNYILSFYLKLEFLKKCINSRIDKFLEDDVTAFAEVQCCSSNYTVLADRRAVSSVRTGEL